MNSPLASPLKVAWHEDKLRAYIGGRPIFPATVEMDITTECNAGCQDCPSGRSPLHEELAPELVDRLFASLEGQTRGLLLSGGEPTIAHEFPRTLAEARRRGFRDVSVVTNGSQLHRRSVQAALLEHGSAVRISLYGWEVSPSTKLAGVLTSIAKLRKQIESTASQLQIGVSLLTTSEMTHSLPDIVSTLREAGAHWLYLHPRCTGWGTGTLGLEEQRGVLEAAQKASDGLSDFELQFCSDRFGDSPLDFSRYHTANFLLVVGADGRLYLGTESKYQPQYVVGALTNTWTSEDLWTPRRSRAIDSASSTAYTPAGGRHRGILYSALIQSLLDERFSVDSVITSARNEAPRFPHVL